MTLERIEELRVDNEHSPYTDYDLPSEEMNELLDAAEAWELLRRAWDRDVRTRFDGAAGYCASETGVTCAVRDDVHSHPTPQATVLAALRPKGGPDAPR